MTISKDIAVQTAKILTASGATEISVFQKPSPPGLGIHEMGTARMGRDPQTSVLNEHNQAHDVKNLFLCDGSSLVTSGRGQPTMTIQALAYRAADRITALAKRGEISA